MKKITRSDVLVASYPGVQGRGKRAPGTHCLHMCLISQISGKIVYFSNLLCYVDVIIKACGTRYSSTIIVL